MHQAAVERRSEGGVSSMPPNDYSKEGKKMFNRYKNMQTYSFSDVENSDANPYVQNANRPMKNYPAFLEEQQRFFMLNDYKNAAKDNIPKPEQAAYDTKKNIRPRIVGPD